MIAPAASSFGIIFSPLIPLTALASPHQQRGHHLELRRGLLPASAILIAGHDDAATISGHALSSDMPQENYCTAPQDEGGLIATTA